MKKKYGIENLKKTALVIIRLGTKLELMVWSWKSVLFTLIPFIARNFKAMRELWKNRQQIALEFKDLDALEKALLNEYISKKLNLENSSIEKIIENSLELIAILSNKIRLIINLIRNGKQ